MIWKDETLSQTIFGDIYLDRTRSDPLLPNLRRITWISTADGNPAQLLPLLSDSVNFLHIEFGPSYNIPADSVNAFFRRLAHRSPNVSDLFLDGLPDVRVVAFSLAGCLKELRKLRVITLPRCFGTSGIVAALGSLGELERISQNFAVTRVPGTGGVAVGTKWELKAGSFQMLKQLDFDATLHQATTLFGQAAAPNLDSVALRASGRFSTGDVKHFAEALVSACQRLRYLILDLFPGVGATDQQLPIDTFAPLLTLTELRQLQIGHHEGIYLTEGDVVNLAEAWPRVEVLELVGGSPTTAASTPLRILNTFADHFHPRLEELALYCCIDKDSLTQRPVKAKLSGLRELDLGTSAISSDDQMIVAAFLGLLCPSAGIAAGTSNWQRPYLRWTPGGFKAYQRNMQLWKVVKEGIKDVQKLIGS